jgi:septal ring factor EnvC (AmiA/AmiB activator)
MRTSLVDNRPGGARRGAALVLTALLAALSLVIALGTERAPGQAVDQIQDATAELDEINAQQGDAQASIDSLNVQIDSLIGEEAALRAQEADVQAQLAAKQAELDAATEELEAAQAYLREVRAQLEQAVAALEDMLVQIYKSEEPDIVGVILESTTFTDAMAQAEYIEQVNDHQDAVIVRVEELRAEIEATVEELTAVRARIEGARDEIAAHRDELASARQEIESRHAELEAAKQERQAALDALQDREQKLAEQISPGASPPGGQRATIAADGTAIAPANAPLAVKAAIEAANQIEDAPYAWGGGHGSFDSSGYDCSGAISYALNGAGLLASPLDSGGFMTWGEPGGGNWITVYAHSGHAFAVIAGLRWDTSGSGGSGPAWYTDMRSSAGYVVRHAPGL